MKISATFVAPVLASLLAGCAQTTTPATLTHVKTAPEATSAREAQVKEGALIVFSAYEVGPPSLTEIDADMRYHTDYEVQNSQGQLVAKVKNRASAFGESPATVRLPVGSYQVLARANGSGRVAIPLVVTSGRTTVLHLEEGGKPTGAAAPLEYDEVRIPGGRVVGWGMVTAMETRR